MFSAPFLFNIRLKKRYFLFLCCTNNKIVYKVFRIVRAYHASRRFIFILSPFYLFVFLFSRAGALQLARAFLS